MFLFNIKLQPEFKYMMDNKGLKASRVCSLVLQGKCGDWEILNNWEIEVPPGKPEPEEPTLPPVITLFCKHS
jgi:hypothetical protein